MSKTQRIIRTKAAERSAHEKRLAEALRENLRRRKAQVRDRRAASPHPMASDGEPGGDDAAPLERGSPLH